MAIGTDCIGNCKLNYCMITNIELYKYTWLYVGHVGLIKERGGGIGGHVVKVADL